MKSRNSKKGQGLVEYVLLVSLLALVSIMALTNMGYIVSSGLMSNISSSLEAANASIVGS